MKLRNKKTGEIHEAISQAPIDVYFYDQAGRDGLTRRSYDSIAELCEEWEDYAPREPLIKDEKIRKAVRAWADANGIHNPLCAHEDMDVVFDLSEHRLTWIDTSIEFDELTGFEHLKDGGCYTIEELCGTPPEPIEPTFVDLDERIKDKEEE